MRWALLERQMISSLLQVLEPIASGVTAIALLFAILSLYRSIGESQHDGRHALKSYSQHLHELMASLVTASREVDSTLSEIGRVASEREADLKRLEEELAKLEVREKQIQRRIDLLGRIPVEAVEHFAELLAPNEKRSARRDYLLFIAGVGVTTIVGVVFRLVWP